jgi:hypothetical protein
MTGLTRLTLLTRRDAAGKMDLVAGSGKPAALEALKRSLLHQAFSGEL